MGLHETVQICTWKTEVAYSPDWSWSADFLNTLKTHNWNGEVDIEHSVLSRSLPRTGEPGGCSYSELWGFCTSPTRNHYCFPVTLAAAFLRPCWSVAPLPIESTKPKVPGIILISSFSLISSSHQWPNPVSSVYNAVDISPLFSTSTVCDWV